MNFSCETIYGGLVQKKRANRMAALCIVDFICLSLSSLLAVFLSGRVVNDQRFGTS